MSISAIAADRALDDAFGMLRPLDQGSPLQSAAALNDRDATRAIMYMLRNAYAHDPLNPRWLCKGARVGVFRINAIGFTLDTTSLDGQPWNIAHVNGQLAYFGLLQFCQDLVAAPGTPGESTPDPTHDERERSEWDQQRQELVARRLRSRSLDVAAQPWPPSSSSPPWRSCARILARRQCHLLGSRREVGGAGAMTRALVMAGSGVYIKCYDRLCESLV
jgi:hypothetical protein